MSKRVSKAAVLGLIEAAIADNYMSPAAKLYRLRYDVQELPTINDSICSEADTINRQAAIDFIDAGRLCNPNEPRWSDNEIVNFLKSRPSAERPSGELLARDCVFGVVYCSECGYELRQNDTNYCPNCGAKMVREDGEANE